MWDWVGGRYSLWSAIGISIPWRWAGLLFDGLLRRRQNRRSAHAQRGPADNLPMMMALLELWQTHFLQANTHAVLPYAQRAGATSRTSCSSSQWRVMASAFDQQAEPLTRFCPVLWGSAGTNRTALLLPALASGHALFQRTLFCHLLSGEGDLHCTAQLAAHALAQSRALWSGDR